MKKLAVLFVVLLTITAFTAPSFADGVAEQPKPKSLILKEIGKRHRADGSVSLCAIMLGDTARQDAVADARSKVMQGPLGVFALNAAHYAPNADGTWRMWNFRTPTPENLMEWVDYITRPEVQEVIETLNKAQAQKDFGGPGEFIWIRAAVPVSELPPPLNRLSAETLAPVLSFFHYNEDGTIRIELKDPFWEGPNARVVFESMIAEISITK